MDNNSNNNITKHVGYNTLQIKTELIIQLECKQINNNIRQEIISNIKNNIVNKTSGVNFILSVNYDQILNNELPLLKLNNIHVYDLVITLPVKYLYFTKNQIVSAYLSIKENNTNTPEVIAYNTYIYCAIILDHNFTINLSEKMLIYKNKEYKNRDSCYIKIIDIYSSDKNTLIPCRGILEDKELHETN
ncbi:RNA polymerase RPO18 [Mythimna separata entomopoxvirus 'L']|uniref:RNA polymerase RPO18 n=1 Tax=Mythimna separata entomopoxvirus 'L' TaxID=1293572 RepID=A0A916KR78_9POXV|nr:RNA polymerase RPO18 [Mythimna separata entomopoxvirus 'L']CCU56451.1 RNA polymerase RPO18 [Mythimna separata entomopoxvirus 'L']